MTDHEKRATPTVVAVSGIPGVGKSTVAELIADRLGADRLRTDEIRKELFDHPSYDDRETDTVYKTLCDRTRRHLAEDRSVVLDATFADRTHRQAVQATAAEYDATLRFVRVVCEQSVLERRITDREGLSDADLSVAEQFRGQFDPIERDHEQIDNSGSLAETRSQVRELF